MTTAKRIVFIGAAGEMCRVAIERFVKAAGDGNWTLELYDIRPELLHDFAAKLPAGSATVGSFDLFDGVALRRAIDGAGHFLQVDRPDAVAAAILAYAGRG